jgi:hypothetical protein
MGLHLENEVYDKLLKTPTIISNNAVLWIQQPWCLSADDKLGNWCFLKKSFSLPTSFGDCWKEK